MVSTFTTNVNLEVPARGDYVATWDTPLDLWATYMDAMRGNTTTVTTTGGNTNLTQAQQNVMRLQVNGALISNATVTLLSGKACRLVVFNNTSGAFTVKILSGGGGSQATIGQGNVTEIFHDGTNITTATVGGSGTVTSVATSGYVSGGPITSTGTISLGSMSAANKLLGSGAGGSTITDISLGTGLSMSSNTLNVTVAGGVTQVNTSGYVTGGAITSVGTISLGSMVGASKLLGSASTAATITDITLGSGLSMSGSTLNATGTVSSVATSGYVTGGTINTTGTISLGSMGSTSRLLGSSSSANTITDITLGTGLGISGTTLSNTGVTSAVAGTGIGVSGATGAVTITNNGVTSNVAGNFISVSGATGAVTVNVANLSGTSQLLGSSASANTPTNITLGGGLTMTGSVLNSRMVLLASGNPSSVATIDLTLTAGYSAYKLFLPRFLPATADAAPIARFSFDSGATYKSGATDYQNSEIYSTSAVASGNAAYNTATGSGLTLTQVGLISTGGPFFYEGTIYPLANGYAVISGLAVSEQSAGTLFTGPMISYCTAASGTTATNIRLSFNTGNIAQSAYLLYGII